MTSLAQMGQAFGNRYLASLYHKEYRKLWSATVCSQSASWALIVARAALILDITDKKHLERLVLAMRKISGIRHVERIHKI